MELSLRNSQNMYAGQGFLRPCEASLRAFEMLPPSSPPLDDILTQTSQRDMSSTQIFRTNCEYFKNLRKDVSSEFLNRPLELSSLERTPVVDISPSGEFTKKPAFPRTRPNYLQTMPLSSNEDTNYKDEDLFQDSSELFTSQCEQRFGSVRESFSRADFANSGDGEGTVSSISNFKDVNDDIPGTQVPAASECNLDTPAQLFIPAFGDVSDSTSHVRGLRSTNEIHFRSSLSSWGTQSSSASFAMLMKRNKGETAVHFRIVMYTDRPLVVCAPTGSGKTVIFELAIIRLLMNSGVSISKARVVYMAPMKALCNERFADWSSKFEAFGLRCKEVTGDSEMDDYFELQNVNVLMTTPEKWDSMTRKWRDNRSLVQSVKLFLIDEVHLLNDDERGATVEAVISRMKTVQSTMTRSTAGTNSTLERVGMRILAISATMPNVEDIAAWLGGIEHPASYYRLDDSHRPVKLRKVVLGFPKGASFSDFRFDLSLNYKLSGIIQTYSDRKPTLVFCSTRKGAQQAAQTLVKEARFIMNSQHRQRLQRMGNSLHDSRLRELVICGIGYHHAGVDPTDRRNVEAMFIKGELPVLFATSTLAVGVNLPAHLVIIKSTSCYAMGVTREYSETQILQMIGRAGRPQFDTNATAVILTTTANKKKYTGLLEGTQNIESSLHHHLMEHLNAEIVLNTITDVSIALEWLKSTFLYIRILKNPTHYGIPEGLDKDSLEQKLQDICLRSLNTLGKAGLIKMDDGFDLKPTEAGRLMARYCIAYDSMKQLLTIKGREELGDMVELISKCKEFSDVKLRVNEKRALNSLNKDKNKETIRFPINGKIKTTDQKVNCLIQATLGCLPIAEFSLNQDVTKIFRAGQRIARCLTELQMLKSDYLSLYNSIILGKCMKARLWENSKFLSRQLEKVGVTLSTMMVKAGLTNFKKIEDTNPREIEMIVNRHPPFGSQIRQAVSSLPKYEVFVQQTGRHQSNRAEIVITVTMTNHITRKDAISSERNSHFSVLLIADADNKVVHKQKLGDAVFLKEGFWSKRVDVQRSEAQSPQLTVNLISQEYVGVDVGTIFTPHYSGAQQLFAKHSVTNTSQNALKNGASKATSKNPRSKSTTPRVPCNHRCFNKETCGHECCRQGVVSKVKKCKTEVQKNDGSTGLHANAKPKKALARNGDQIGVKNSMDSFLKNLHQRTQAIPDTPAAKRLKMTETRGTDFVDSTLDGRFRYIPKTSYNQQAQSCKMKGEVVDLDDKRTFGDRCWKEIDWHKKRLKEQTKAEDFSDDENLDDELPCFSVDELWKDDELSLSLSDPDEIFLSSSAHQSSWGKEFTGEKPQLYSPYFKPELLADHRITRSAVESKSQQDSRRISQISRSQDVLTQLFKAKTNTTNSADKNFPKVNHRHFSYPPPPPRTPGVEDFEESRFMGSGRSKCCTESVEQADHNLIIDDGRVPLHTTSRPHALSEALANETLHMFRSASKPAYFSSNLSIPPNSTYLNMSKIQEARETNGSCCKEEGLRVGHEFMQSNKGSSSFFSSTSFHGDHQDQEQDAFANILYDSL